MTHQQLRHKYFFFFFIFRPPRLRIAPGSHPSWTLGHPARVRRRRVLSRLRPRPLRDRDNRGRRRRPITGPVLTRARQSVVAVPARLGWAGLAGRNGDHPDHTRKRSVHRDPRQPPPARQPRPDPGRETKERQRRDLLRRHPAQAGDTARVARLGRSARGLRSDRSQSDPGPGNLRSGTHQARPCIDEAVSGSRVRRRDAPTRLSGADPCRRGPRRCRHLRLTCHRFGETGRRHRLGEREARYTHASISPGWPLASSPGTQ